MKNIVFTNGSYDVITFGHNKLFEYAKSLGKFLVCAIDSDDRVKERKGNDRPFHNAHQRKFNLESNVYIDQVIVFSTDKELESLVALIRPDYMVVGDEYKDKVVIGSQFAKNLIFFDMPRVTSSSKIIESWKK